MKGIHQNVGNSQKTQENMHRDGILNLGMEIDESERKELMNSLKEEG